MTVATRSASMGAHRRIQARRDIGAILGFGGADYTIIPLGDKKHETDGRTTTVGIGRGAAKGRDFICSKAISDFDTPPRYHTNQLELPSISFNGTDEQVKSADFDILHVFSGGSNQPLSTGMWINAPPGSTWRQLFNRYTNPSLREWYAHITTGDRFSFGLADEIINDAVSVSTYDVIPTNEWIFVVSTFNGAEDSEAVDGIGLYVNAHKADVNKTINVNYSKSTGTGSKVSMCSLGSNDPNQFYDGWIRGGDIGPFWTRQELLQSQISRLYSIGIAAQG